MPYPFYANVGGGEPGEALLQLKVVLSLLHLTTLNWSLECGIMTHFTLSCWIVFKCSHFTKIHLCLERKHFNVWVFSILLFKLQPYFHILLNYSHWLAYCLRGCDIWLRITKQSSWGGMRGASLGVPRQRTPPPVHGTSGSWGQRGSRCCLVLVLLGPAVPPEPANAKTCFRVQKWPSLLCIIKRNKLIITNCIRPN